MVWIDIVCCVIIAIFALLGLWHGLLKSIFKLVAWVAGLLGAYFATDVIGNFIATNLEIDGLTVKIICVCVGFLVPFLLFSFIGHFLHNVVKDSAISGVNSVIGTLNKLPGVNIGTIGSIPYLAKGGIVAKGSAIVGEAGPELLTVANGRTVVQPLTNNTSNTANYGGVTINVYPAQGQDAESIADCVMDKIQHAVDRNGAVWA